MPRGRSPIRKGPEEADGYSEVDLVLHAAEVFASVAAGARSRPDRMGVRPALATAVPSE